MIKSFAHKGLERFFFEDMKKGIQQKHVEKISDILDMLDAALSAQDMNFPGAGLHQLKGKLAKVWAVKVSGNWRVTFKIENGNAYDVDYIDYH